MNNFDHELDELMKSMAQGHQPELPSPGLIWWRARIQRKLAARERIERPMRIMRAISLAIVCLVLLALLAANWQQLGETRSLLALGIVALVSFAIAASLVLRAAPPRS